MTADTFRPALIVVDFQEDFCPPNGALAVGDGRSIAAVVNDLLQRDFVTKIATKDWHPADHTSFASNHPGAEPFISTTAIVNPRNPAEEYTSRLWPVHCVQGTAGAELVPELDVTRIDEIVEKGQVREVEMYSAFYDPFKAPRVADSGLAGRLRDAGVTDVYVVGLAGDYCVKCTALDAASEGFNVWLVEEGTRCVDPGSWEDVKTDLQAAGVKVVSATGPEVRRVPGPRPAS
ncbi:isochorismatase [Plectosphaerella cucumerina]|uniref:nicotinamidase n=1 Tax=Plectosphaerella cucumerina TaxID=40658 RepID=A0A8K0TLF8_9PEZI|nr:isochorismatase [Plectosphaerella cucumerina]